jgi:hypothetical protein
LCTFGAVIVAASGARENPRRFKKRILKGNDFSGFALVLWNYPDVAARATFVVIDIFKEGAYRFHSRARLVAARAGTFL